MERVTGSDVPWWKWGLFSLGAIFLTVLLMTAALIALALEGVDFRDYLEVARPAWITSGRVAFWIALMVVAQSAAMVGVATFFRPARRLAFAHLRPPQDRRGLLVRVLLGAGLAVLVQAVWSWVGPVPQEEYRLMEHLVYAVSHGKMFWPWVWLLVAATVAGPLAEEVVYRGLLQGWLVRRWGTGVGMAGSAVLFGLAHGWASALPAGVLGLWFAYQVQRDQSLFGAVLLHAAHNLGAVVVIAQGM